MQSDQETSSSSTPLKSFMQSLLHGIDNDVSCVVSDNALTHAALPTPTVSDSSSSSRSSLRWDASPRTPMRRVSLDKPMRLALDARKLVASIHEGDFTIEDEENEAILASSSKFAERNKSLRGPLPHRRGSYGTVVPQISGRRSSWDAIF